MINYCKVHGTHPDQECQKCIDETPEEAKDPWFCVSGQDIARDRDYSAYASIKIEHGIGRVKRLFIWPHTDYDVVMADTMKFLRLDRARSLCVDVTRDSKVGEDYRKIGAPISPIKFTLESKQNMVEYYRLLGSKGLLKTPTKGPFVRELEAQFSEQERRTSLRESTAFGSETVKFGHPSGRNDDLFWSLMLASWAAAPYLTNPVFAVRIS